jgi:putative transposase
MRHFRHRRWHLDEVFVKINGVKHYLSRAVDHEGEVLESCVEFPAEIIVPAWWRRSNRRGSVGVVRAALKTPGAAGKRETGRWLNNRAENSHQPFRRRERAMLRFRRMRSLQKFAALHGPTHDHVNSERTLVNRQSFKDRRTAALAEWRHLCAA